jgi:hypothetical protein
MLLTVYYLVDERGISREPKLPESTRRPQAMFNKGSLFYSHCASSSEEEVNTVLPGRMGAKLAQSVNYATTSSC